MEHFRVFFVHHMNPYLLRVLDHHITVSMSSALLNKVTPNKDEEGILIFIQKPALNSVCYRA